MGPSLGRRDLDQLGLADGAGAVANQVDGDFLGPAAEVEADDASGLAFFEGAISKGTKLW